MKYIDKSLDEYIDDLSSGDSVPGGGSVAPLTASLGAGLTLMVMNLTKNSKAFKKLDERIQSSMLEYEAEIRKILEDLKRIVDEDTKAFDSVIEAYKMPKSSKEEKEKRKESIDAGYRRALEPPLECFRLSYSLLEKQPIFAEYGNANLITDIAIASSLIYTAIESSVYNIIINLNYIEDGDLSRELEAEVEAKLKSSKDLRKTVLALVEERL